jgi:hypothetical protein
METSASVTDSPHRMPRAAQLSLYTPNTTTLYYSQHKPFGTFSRFRDSLPRRSSVTHQIRTPYHQQQISNRVHVTLSPSRRQRSISAYTPENELVTSAKARGHAQHHLIHHDSNYKTFFFFSFRVG